MAYNIDKANYRAKYSCPAWNKNKYSRKFFRELYYSLVTGYFKSPEAQERTFKYQEHHQNCLDVSKNFLLQLLDTYPWPYNDLEFANWEEDYTEGNDSIVIDQSSCVIKHGTSYAAWKIFEATGVWPARKRTGIVEPNEWQEFLAEAGYETTVDAPDDNGYYVGINPDLADPVVWYEGTMNGDIVTSTYKQKSYRLLDSKPEEYTWIKIK